MIRSTSLLLITIMSCLSAQAMPLTQRAVADRSTCIRVHSLWKTQLQTVKQNGGKVPVQGWVEQVYRPNSAFWNGYLGDDAAFRSWAAKFTLAGDPREAVPLNKDISGEIRRVSYRAAALADRPVPCSDWYVVFGPGWTNMGGVGDVRMVVDFMGMPKDSPLADFDIYLPHEINHLMWSAARPGAPPGPLLERIVNEGFASYFAATYEHITAARSVGYTPQQWHWALSHEAELWKSARPFLASEDKNVINRFVAVSSHVQPSAPGKIGYFIGYRIVEAYVARHGPNSWKKLYGMTAQQILDASGYTATPVPNLNKAADLPECRSCSPAR